MSMIDLPVSPGETLASANGGVMSEVLNSGTQDEAEAALDTHRTQSPHP